MSKLTIYIMPYKLTLSAFLRFMESRTAFFGAIILFRVALEIGYLNYVHPYHAYSGFTFDFSALKYIESWAILFLLMGCAPAKLNKPSDFFILILLLGLLVPLLSLYSLADYCRSTLYIVLFGYMLIELFRRGTPLRIPRIKNAIFISFGLALAGAMSVTLWFFYSGGVVNFNLDLTQVYEYRQATGELINVGPMGYINIWATKVFGPFLLAYALLRRNWLLAVSAIGLHVFWFGVTAHKAPLFYPLIILFLWFYFRKTKALAFLPLGYLAVILATLSCFYIFDYGVPASMFIRRVFYVIANNTFDYYTFFGAEQFVYWSNSITSRILEYPYHIDPPKLIGQWRGTEAHVNNTFLSTGYMHAGVIGIVFYSVVVGLLFRIIDSLVTEDVPVWFLVALLSIPMRSLLLEADLPTALLTHGIFMAMILAFFARSGSNFRIRIFPKPQTHTE